MSADDDTVEKSWLAPIQLGRIAWLIRGRRRLVSAAVVGVSVLTCVGLSAIAGSQPISRRLDHLAWEFLPVAFGAHIVAYAGYLVAHHEVFRRLGQRRLNWRRDAQIAVIGFGGWLIGGGFGVDRRAQVTAGFSEAQAACGVVTLGAVELAVLTPAAWICAVELNGTKGVAGSVTVPWMIAVPVGFLLVTLLIGTDTLRMLRGLARRPHRAWLIALTDGLEGTVRLLGDPVGGPTAVAGIVLYWAADLVALWAALRFVGVDLGFTRLMVGYATAYFFTRRTLPFAGAPIIEGLLTVSLVWVGLPLAAAVLAVMVYRLSDFVLTLLGALAVSNIAERSLTFLPPEPKR